MKNLKFYVLVCLLGGLPSVSWSLTDVNFSGELDLALTLRNLPSRYQGQTAFSVPRLDLNLEMPLRDNNEIFIDLETAEQRDGTSKRFDTQLKEAYLSLTSILPARSELRYGLIPDFYNELQREQWDFDFWGRESYLPMIRYNYMAWSDLGVMYQSELPADWGQWALSITNGEGYAQDEIGPRKQAQLLLGLTKAAPFYAMLVYTYGAYDNYDPAFNKKTRLIVNMSYEFSRALLAVEYFMTKDPADAIQLVGVASKGQIASGVDVTSQLGTSIDGQGGSLFGRFDMTEKADLFLRADFLQPVKTAKAKNLKSLTAGVSYDTNEDMRWALAYEMTDYSEEFNSMLRDESQLVLATRVSF